MVILVAAVAKVTFKIIFTGTDALWVHPNNFPYNTSYQNETPRLSRQNKIKKCIIKLKIQTNMKRRIKTIGNLEIYLHFLGSEKTSSKKDIWKCALNHDNPLQV